MPDQGDSARATSEETRAALPFAGRVAPFHGGWSVLVPVSAEQCDVEKRAVEYERVTVRLDRVQDVQRVTARVRREELAIDAEGDSRHDRPTVRLEGQSRTGPPVDRR